MKAIPATLLSLTIGWAITFLGVVLAQWVFWGHFEDLVPIAFWTGLFAFAGWIVAVLPLAKRFVEWKLFSSVAYGWFGWSLLGVVAYVLLTVPWLGREALGVIWYPAAIGAVAGMTFSLICHRDCARDRS